MLFRSRKDLHLAPDLKSGFEMVLLRALAFRPDAGPTVKQDVAPVVPQEAEPSAKKPKPAQRAEVKALQPKPVQQNSPVAPQPPLTPVTATAVARDLLQEPSAHREPSAYREPSAEPSAHKEPSANKEQEPSAHKEPSANKEQAPAIEPPAPTAQQKQPSDKINLQNLAPHNWIQVHSDLDIGASLGEIASHCLYSGRQGNQLQFVIDSQQTSLYDSAHQQGLAEALSDYFGVAVSVEINFGVADKETPRAADIRQKQQRMADAVQTLNSDPDMIECKQRFDAALDEQTVRPIDADK